ncbi:hypothetical protein PRIC1_003184 [Phytophthora ramorum]
MTSPDGQDVSEYWAEEYYRQQVEAGKTHGWKNLLHPTAIAAFLAITGRIVIGPLAMLLLFTVTGYLSDASVLIQADQSIFAFTERDGSMAGGCTGCLGPCKIVMLKYTLLKGVAIASAPTFFTLTSIAPNVSLYDFSPLSDEVLAFADALDVNGTLCQSSFNEWGTAPIVVTGTAQELFNIIRIAELNLSPQMVRELELAIEHADECISKWTMMSVVRLFQYPTSAGSAEFGHIPAVDTHVFPDYTECRPDVELNDDLVGSKLVLETEGEDLLAVVPDELTLFPYSFTSSLPPISRIVPADKAKTKNGATTVVESSLRGYYGGCRVRAVNTTGVYIEDTCEMSKHWLSYGLMVHSPDDIPLCSTGDKAPFESILAQNAEILRKTSERGAKYCGLNDACVLFTVNMPIVIAVLSVGVGVVAVITSFLMMKMSPKMKSVVRSARLSVGGANVTQKVAVSDSNSKKQTVYETNSTENDHLTSFERNCIGAPFHKLFWDCDDMAYVMYKGRRCSSVEALLLTGYLYYGEHIYQASSVMLLLIARLLPQKILRTFNVLILRWYVDPKEGTLSQALTCTWYHACEENHKWAGATPVA